MTDFDIIIGMDWLMEYRAHIDCYQRKVTFRTPDGSKICFIGDRCLPSFPSHLDSILASLWSDKSSLKNVELPLVVCDYADVFPETLPGMPPKRHIEFRIDLLPGSTPIAMPTYRTSPAEKDELEKQIVELRQL